MRDLPLNPVAELPSPNGGGQGGGELAVSSPSLARLARAALRLAPDLAAILALSVASVALVATAPPGPLGLLRVALGVPFVLFYPGYCLQWACFAARDDLDNPQRLALSVGLSVAAIPPVALLLDKLPWGIRTWPIMLSLLVVILAAGSVALVRRWRMPAEARPTFAIVVDVPGWWADQDRTNRILFTVFGLAVLTAFASAAALLILPKPGERFTEFYMLGPAGLAESYPRQAAPGQPVTVTVGITNREGVPATYLVRVGAAGWLMAISPVVSLQPGATWEQPITFTLPAAGDDQQVDFVLQRDGQPAIYRQLRLFINITIPGAP